MIASPSQSELSMIGKKWKSIDSTFYCGSMLTSSIFTVLSTGVKNSLKTSRVGRQKWLKKLRVELHSPKHSIDVLLHLGTTISSSDSILFSTLSFKMDPTFSQAFRLGELPCHSSLPKKLMLLSFRRFWVRSAFMHGALSCRKVTWVTSRTFWGS